MVTKYLSFLLLKVQSCSITLALSKLDMEALSSCTIFSSSCASSTLLFCLKNISFLPDHIIDHNQVLSLNKNFSDLNNLGLDLGPIIVGEISTSFLYLMKTSAPSC